jgi:CHAT domain-containing protein
LCAASRTAVASLRVVNDQSTSLFMESFFRNLKAAIGRAEALRRPRAELMPAKRYLDGVAVSYAAPYFRAPFILVGSRG